MKKAQRYFGKVCARHPEAKGERYLSSRSCASCVCERSDARRLADPESAKRYSRQRYAANLENSRKYVREYARRWKVANREAVREYDRQWYAANAVKRIAKESGRRAKKREQRPVLTAVERAQYQEFFDIARARTVQTGVKWVVDHDRPLARGGLDHPSNLAVIPETINSAKGARHDSTFAFLIS